MSEEEEGIVKPMNKEALDEAIIKNPLLGITLRVWNEKAKERLLDRYRASEFLKSLGGK